MIKAASIQSGKSHCFIFPVLLILFLLVSGIGTGTLMGQSIAGTWYDSQYNIKLMLYNNGTYQIQHPNGFSQGRYSVEGTKFCLYDQSGTSTVCYTVDGFSANQLVLKDTNGVAINYKRQMPAGQTPNTGSTPPARQTQPASSPSSYNTGNLLAQKGNLSLYNGHFEIGLGLTQFIIGQSVKPSEVIELRNKLIEEFKQFPDKMLAELAQLGASLKKIRTLTNPVQIGYARQQLFAALYQATRQMQEHQKPLMIQVMNRYIKVLAYDAQNNLVLTDRDARGMMHYLAFNSELAGNKVELNRDVYNAVAAEMVKNFSTMKLEQKRMLCSASLIWKSVEFNWNRLSQAQKQQYKNAYAAQVQSQYQSAQPNQGYQGYTPQPPTGNSGKTAAQMMREYNSRQQMWKMMNNMSLQSHATSMNIIENMGGTGNYWEVVDY